MVGVVTFGARKAGRRGGSGFVLARDAGGTNPVVQRRSCERGCVCCGSTFEIDTDWASCVGHVCTSVCGDVRSSGTEWCAFVFVDVFSFVASWA